MKHLIFLLCFICFVFSVNAQQKSINDNPLRFDQRFTKCEKKWVALSGSDTSSKYTFGYIYIDSAAGFTFDLKGSFKIKADNTYIPDTTASKNTSIKYRIAPNWKNVAILSPQHFKELNIK